MGSREPESPASRERRTAVTEEAAEWLLQLQAGEPSHAVRSHLVDWLRESPVNVAEFLRVCQVHGALQEFADWAAIPPMEATNVVDATRAVEVGKFVEKVREAMGDEREAADYRRQRSRVLPWISAVAAATCGVGVAVVWLTGVFSWHAIETETAERRQVALADGSVVDVSPETRLKVRFQEGERLVVLERGDALFRVARDARRPFVVGAGQALIRAVGTWFGVQRRADASVVVTVAEGRVAVTRDDGSAIVRTFGKSLPFVAAPVALEEIALSAGQQIDVPKVGEIGSVREVDTARELAWAEGRLVFENASVADVVGKFNRFNRVQMRVADGQLAARPVSGVFNASDPESFIEFIQTVAHVKVERGEEQEIVISPGK